MLPLIELALGGALLIAGRRLYWLLAATMGFVADQLNVSAPSLTAASARDGLASRGITEAMLDELAELLRSFDAMRFGGLSPSLEQRRALLEKTGQWIETVHRQLAKGGR